MYAFSDKWIRRFLELAGSFASWSKDPSTQCGAVIIDHNRHIVGAGYNGFPPDVPDREDWLNDRDIKYNLVKHAEENAIKNAHRNVDGCILFVTHPCCPDCAQFVCDEGIREVHWYEPSSQWAERWRERLEDSKEIFRRECVPTFSHPMPFSVDLLQKTSDDTIQAQHRSST